ncbi:MAG TPA: hypothetical protein VF185_02385 [Patescibacteria group bacterium]
MRERSVEKVKPVAIINIESPWRSVITSEPEQIDKIRQAGNISRSKYHNYSQPTSKDFEVWRRRPTPHLRHKR